MIRTQDDQARAGQGRAAPVTLLPVRIRLARPDDRNELGSFFEGLSVQTRYLRFFAALEVSPAMLRILAGDGGADVVVATGDGAVVGHGMATYQVSPEGASVMEIGVVVADAWQGRGVGSALVRALIAAARNRGASILTMDVLPGNRKVLGMIASHWPAASLAYSADGVVIRVRLQPREGERGVRDAA